MSDKIEKKITVVRVREDGSQTKYTISHESENIQIDQGGDMFIYFPKHLKRALVSAINEVCENIPMSLDQEDASEETPLDDEVRK